MVRKKKKRDPCHATGMEDRRPADPTARNAACFPIEITPKVFSVRTRAWKSRCLSASSSMFSLGPRISPCLSRRLPDQPTWVVGKLLSDILRAVIQDFLSVCQAHFPRALQWARDGQQNSDPCLVHNCRIGTLCAYSYEVSTALGWSPSASG